MDYAKLGTHTVNARRLLEVLQVLVRHGFADLVRRAGLHHGLPARVLRGLQLNLAREGAPETLGERLRAALTELGPTFIKLGQILSTRPDMIGAEMAGELSLLQDRVLPRSFADMAAVAEAELGGTIGELFLEFDPEPVASASLSQVYRARLHDGSAVAVKILRPGVGKTVESDLRLLRQIAEWIKGRFEDIKSFDPPGIVAEFERALRRELDLEIEAGIIERFREKTAGMEGLVIPAVYRDHSRPQVLTMEWLDGVRVDRFDLYKERGCNREVVARLCCEILCQLVFEHRIFHADPHPGNIFILRDNQIALLDLGMAGHLEPGDTDSFADLLLGVFQEDAAACVRAILDLSAEGIIEYREPLEHELAEFIAFEAQAIFRGGQVARGIERAVQIMRAHHLELAPRFTLLFKAVATIETVGRTLSPGLDFVPIIQPFVERLVIARCTPSNVFDSLQQDMRTLLHLRKKVPGDVLHFIQQLRHGKLQIRLCQPQLEHLASTLDRTSNRQALSILTAALIVGSSLVVSAGGPMSRLGIAGFACAGLLGISVVVSILRSRRY